jgi:hypothetical protein
MSTQIPTVLVIGGTGAQGVPVVKGEYRITTAQKHRH